MLALFLGVVSGFVAMGTLASGAEGEVNAPARPQTDGPLAPLYRLVPSSRSCGLSASAPKPAWNQRGGPDSIAFFAGVGDAWPTGWVPLFEVEKAGRMELRRFPLQGQENFSAPLCFILPMENDRAAACVAGRWICTGNSPQRASHPFVLELTTSGDQVVGRFDQNSDYRVAAITGGTFRTNHLELTVAYVGDRFQLEATWHDGMLNGTWRQLNADDQGVWDGVRAAAPTVPASRITAPLHEWRRGADGGRSYHLPNAALGPEWQRMPVPLGRVWLPSPIPQAPLPAPR